MGFGFKCSQTVREWSWNCRKRLSVYNGQMSFQHNKAWKLMFLDVCTGGSHVIVVKKSGVKFHVVAVWRSITSRQSISSIAVLLCLWTIATSKIMSQQHYINSLYAWSFPVIFIQFIIICVLLYYTYLQIFLKVIVFLKYLQKYLEICQICMQLLKKTSCVLGILVWSICKHLEKIMQLHFQILENIPYLNCIVYQILPFVFIMTFSTQERFVLKPVVFLEGGLSLLYSWLVEAFGMLKSF